MYCLLVMVSNRLLCANFQVYGWVKGKVNDFYVNKKVSKFYINLKCFCVLSRKMYIKVINNLIRKDFQRRDYALKTMVEFRWHGRGGQGAWTASELLARTALDEGKYIQSFPEFGPERMGAPVTAFTRISTEPIQVTLCNL